MRIELIVNVAGAGEVEELRDAVAGVRAAGHAVRGWVTFEPGDAARLAAEACERGADMLIVAGGDGTVNEAVNGLLQGRDPRAASGRLPVLGILPMGTANDMANWLEVPEEVPLAFDRLLSAPVVDADALRVNERFFLNVSTGGFGAEASDEAPATLKRALGGFAYVITGVRKFVTLEPSRARFSAKDEVVYDGEFLLFSVGNGARTGGGNFLTPRADLQDGLLDVCIVRAVSHAEFLRLLPDLRSGSHVGRPEVVYRQLSELIIEPQGEEISVNVDGEPVEGRRFHYAVVPAAIRLAVPGAMPAGGIEVR